MLQFFSYLAAALLLIQPVAASAAIELVDNVDIAWTFQPAGSAEKYKLKHLSIPVIQQIPKSTPCCSGIYEGRLLRRGIRDLTAELGIRFPVLHFPPIYGLKAITINGEVILDKVTGDYGSSGPIINLTKEQLAANALTIAVEINYHRSIFAGFWWLNQGLVLGGPDEITSRRERKIFFQRYLPLFWTSFFLLVALLLIWLSYVNGGPERKLSAFLETTLLWALFYFALSGELRHSFPYWGGYLHLILRSLACLSSVRLLLIMFDRKSLEILTATVLGLITILLGGILSWPSDYRWQLIGYIFINIEFALVFFLTITDRTPSTSDGPIYKFFIVSGTLLVISSTLDTANLVGTYFFNNLSPLPFFNRYLIPPFILSSLVYITQRASLQTSAEKRRNILEKFSEQLLHDLRSPATAIRNVALSSQTSGNDRLENEILATASERIISMCRTLKVDDRPTTTNDVVDVLSSLNDVILEKDSEWKKTGLVQIKATEGPFNASVPRHEFKRVISNILNNAYEANPISTKIEVRVEAKNTSIQISISDNGGGIAEDVLREIKAGNIKSTKVSGRGIGLLNARESAGHWNGTLKVRSNTGVGTTIDISVPRA